MATDKSKLTGKAIGEAEKQMRKQHILDSAEKVMGERGIHKLSIAAVAKEASLAQGTLYLYFKSKEDMLAHITLKARRSLLNCFYESIQGKENPLEEYRAILLANYTFYQQNRLHYDLVSFYEGSKELVETPQMAQASQNINALVISILDRAKNQGLVKSSINATQVALISWGACVGLVQLIDVKTELVESTLGKPAVDFYHAFVEQMIDSIRA